MHIIDILKRRPAAELIRLVNVLIPYPIPPIPGHPSSIVPFRWSASIGPTAIALALALALALVRHHPLASVHTL